MKKVMKLKVMMIVLFLFSPFTSGEKVVEVTDTPPCLTGQSYQLTCILHQKRSFIKWKKKGDIDSIVFCYKTECTINPKYQDKYNFTANIDEGIVDLIMNNVEDSDNGIKLLCSVGEDSDFREIYTGDIKENGNGTLKASTAYFSRKMKVSITWTKIDNVTGENVKVKPNMKQNNVSCSEGCDDNTIRTVQYIPTIPNGNGTILNMTVDYGNGKVESKLTRNAYEIEEQATDCCHGNPNVVAGATHLTVAVAVAAVLLVVITTLTLRKKRLLQYCRSRLHTQKLGSAETPQEECNQNKAFLKSDDNCQTETLVNEDEVAMILPEQRESLDENTDFKDTEKATNDKDDKPDTHPDTSETTDIDKASLSDLKQSPSVPNLLLQRPEPNTVCKSELMRTPRELTKGF